MTLPFKLRDISPVVHDKYSPRLFGWLRKQGAKPTNVYKDEDGKHWIGHVDPENGWFHGCSLDGILCGRHGAGGRRAYPGAARIWKLKEVKTFWARYLLIGRCVLDPKHVRSFVGGCLRYARNKNHRTCRWCGQRQKVTTRKETIVHESWSNI